MIIEPKQFQRKAQEPDELLRIAESLRISAMFPVPRPEYYVHANNCCISTPGNITGIIGASKSGKSAFMSSLISGAIQDALEMDCFGFKVAPNKQMKVVMSIDSEMSEYDSYRRHIAILKMGAFDREPEYFRSYLFRTIPVRDRFQSLELLIDKQAQAFGGVHMLFGDGIADFVASVNDEAECNDAVHKFEAIAIKYKCPVILVLHLNPGSDSKTRGHLGSQLERKAESILVVSKRDGISSIEGKLLRNSGDIPIQEFVYDQTAGHHVSIGKKDKIDEKAELLRSFIQEVIIIIKNEPGEMISYMGLVDKVMENCYVKIDMAKKKIANIKKLGYLTDVQRGGKKMIQINQQIPNIELL